MSELEQLEAQGRSELAEARDDAALHAWNQRWFGKTGLVPLALKKLPEMPPPERKGYGQAVNKLKEMKEYLEGVVAGKYRYNQMIINNF